MSDTVVFQINHLGSSWKDGDVIATNHPSCGGSHLPDITVISPVFVKGKAEFFVASRGHHADIGGISPGSMPPLSKWLSEEGAALKSFKLVENGQFQEESLCEVLKQSRNLKDNISDLKAQVASNQKGIALLHSLIGTSYHTYFFFFFFFFCCCLLLLLMLSCRGIRIGNGTGLHALRARAS
jgi:5-oxoprolinase (ATP-hydrolysing)